MRLKQIDVLRAVAILLVMGAHLTWNPLWVRVGWTGVDLFFVLSGYLISGLLFREYRETGQIRLFRFLMRRGLKIYPAYYLLVLATFIHNWSGLTWGKMWPDLFFAQSYVMGSWAHFWSLAVEEQFYFLLPILLLALAKMGQGDADPFRRLPLLWATLAVTCLSLRAVSMLVPRPLPYQQIITPAHLRMDSLGFGVLLSYLASFRPWIIDRVFAGGGPAVLGASIALLTPAIWLPEMHPLMYTAGLSCLYLGFGGLLLFSLRLVTAAGKVAGALSAIGKYSYTIYLIHMPLAIWSVNAPYAKWGRNTTYLVYLFLSIAGGALLSRLVEIPVLRFRDRIFPVPTK
jgi:peptidoglycan/LPS O-acetylase OafA/YrhL